MDNQTTSDIIRNEIVLLEDDPETLDLIRRNLETRDIKVHAFAKGAEALQRILHDPNIGALVTDIAIHYPYPNGFRNGLQGYDVANKIGEHSTTKFLSIIVLTSLVQEEALDSQNLFTVRHHNFSKMKWLKLTDQKEIDLTFEALALIIKEHIQETPKRFINELIQIYPRSRWLIEQKEKSKVYPAYLNIYRKLWFSYTWPTTEKQIGEKAEEIVKSYMRGDVRKLRGEYLSLTENPNEITFLQHLIGRRVIYALKATDPIYWEKIIRGEKHEEEKTSITMETWQKINSENLRLVVNELNAYSAEKKLVNNYNMLQETLNKLESLEEKRQEDTIEYKKLLESKLILEKDLSNAKKMRSDSIMKISKLLEDEDEQVQKGFIPYLRFWNLDFTEVDWAKKPKTTGGGKDPITQTLLLLGIRKQDIEDDNYNNWRLLLPEEIKWLTNFLKK